MGWPLGVCKWIADHQQFSCAGETNAQLQNFEVGNLFSLSDEGYGNEDIASDFFQTLGTEGGNYPIPSQTSPMRDMLWANGNVSKLANGSIHFEPTMAGRLDWGREAYAAAGKLVPASSKASRRSGTDVDRFISYVWLTGNDFGQSGFPGESSLWLRLYSEMD